MHLLNRRPRLVASFLLFAVFIHICVFSIPEAFAADWYDSDWTYRKRIDIKNSTGAGTNYQINVTVHYGSGSDSGYDVYLNEHCQTDFDDLIFTDDDEETLLDYWIQEKTDSDYAFVWFEVQDDLGSDQSVYIYYGNNGASSVSNIKSTFVTGDDFDDGELDTSIWTIKTGTPLESGTTLTVEYVGGIRDWVDGDVGFGVNHAIHSKWKVDDLVTYGNAIGAFSLDLSDRIRMYRGGGNSWRYRNMDDLTSTSTNEDQEDTNYHVFVAEWTSTNVVYKRDGVQKADHNTNIPSGENLYSVLGAQIDTSKTIIEWFFVRHYLSPEPFISGYGEEEELAYTVTFYQNLSNGYFYTNCTTLRINGTTVSMGADSVLRLECLPQTTYGFANFTWNTSNTTLNRYNLTITENTTIWMYLVQSGGGVSGISKEFVFAGFFLLILILAPIIVIVIRR